jgi:hypothetical protein
MLEIYKLQIYKLKNVIIIKTKLSSLKLSGVLTIKRLQNQMIDRLFLGSNFKGLQRVSTDSQTRLTSPMLQGG